MKAGGKKGFKEGDWICESCGDHQFARNDSCRKCGVLRSVVASNNQVSKAGDWICPNPDCRDLQFEKNMSCRRCGEPKPGTGAPIAAAFGKGKSRANFSAKVDAVPAALPRGHKPGDWICSGCGDHQFARNTTCRKCGTPKEEADDFETPATPRGRGIEQQLENAVPAAAPRGHKPGDWICSGCGDHQFARNTACRKCGAPKEESDNFETPASPRGRGIERQLENVVPAAPPRGHKPGDWICSSCGDHNFARNTACRKCGAPKEESDNFETPASLLEVDQPPKSSSMDAMKGKGSFKDGDWICSACGDHQFARNDSCRKCGMVRSVVASNNQESKAGDWICPNPDCRDLQFERNTSCRRCGEPKPNAAGPAVFGKGKSPSHLSPQTKGANFVPEPRSRAVHAESRYERQPPPVQASFQPREDKKGFKEGDWICESCGDHQFARNDVCRKCGVVRAVVASNNQTSRAGDWICPNPDCRDLQFEKNMSCRRCGEPKPGIGAPIAAAFGKGKPPVRSSPQAPKGACSGAASGKGKPAGLDASHGKGKGKPGDWTCPACGDNQFARNEACRRCGEAKPQIAKNGQAMKPGDWICPNPDCGDVQFARNENCRKCGEAKPESDRDRSRSPLR